MTHEHRTFADFTILKKSKQVSSATRVLGYPMGTRVTDIEMGTWVPVLITNLNMSLDYYITQYNTIQCNITQNYTIQNVLTPPPRSSGIFEQK